jgi:hypothetical protein
MEKRFGQESRETLRGLSPHLQETHRLEVLSNDEALEEGQCYGCRVHQTIGPYGADAIPTVVALLVLTLL